MGRSELIQALETIGDGDFGKKNARLASRWLKHRSQVIQQSAWEVENLQRTFEATSSDKGSFPGDEDLPVMFEIAKKLHDLLLRHRSLFLDEEDEITESNFGKPNNILAVVPRGVV